MTHAPNSLAAKDIAYNLHGYTNWVLHRDKGPLLITRGENIYVFDDEGNKYIEGLAGLWCVSLGFSEPRLVAAASRQLEVMPFSHNFAHRATAPVIELAEKLIGIAPEPMSKVFFVNSGSEAVDSAVRFVWYYNNARGRLKKKKIISRLRGYHGVTVAAGSLTAIPMMQKDFDLPRERFLHTDTPHYYRHAEPGESESKFSQRLANNLDRLIEEEGADTVAAFIAEPVMGAGGVIVPPEAYFEKIQAVLKKHDVLMIADEVICGFGRTGNMWGSQTYGIRPDMVTCAKQLSSGYLPIAALMISDELYQVMADNSKAHGGFGMGYTYGAHPVSAAVALETLKIYEERDMVNHVRRVSPSFQARLRALADHALVGQARGVGLIGAVELVADKGTRAQFDPAIKAAQGVAERAQANGLIVRGLTGDSVAICPPLIIDEKQINDLFDRFKRALDEAATEIRKKAA
ncbi:MAG: aspartate aminotransferase family protein [Gammaproteobacteria bacterium]|nr:aspartate aminotransferase family protein [Gammaproteobacteria bacterium]